MALPLLIVPGLGGSHPQHWQHWLAQQLPDYQLATGIDWQQPVLAQWAMALREQLARSATPVWVLAHDFGCLAAVVAAADRPEKIAQLLLVAPANPLRFDCMGFKPELLLLNERFCLSRALPRYILQVSGKLVASRNDPWLPWPEATDWAATWGLDLLDAGKAGHLDAASGHGLWPKLLRWLRAWQRAGVAPPVTEYRNRRKGRGSALAAVRQLTREQMQSPQDHRLWQAQRGQ